MGHTNIYHCDPQWAIPIPTVESAACHIRSSVVIRNLLVVLFQTKKCRWMTPSIYLAQIPARHLLDTVLCTHLKCRMIHRAVHSPEVSHDSSRCAFTVWSYSHKISVSHIECHLAFPWSATVWLSVCSLCSFRNVICCIGTCVVHSPEVLLWDSALMVCAASETSSVGNCIVPLPRRIEEVQTYDKELREVAETAARRYA